MSVKMISAVFAIRDPDMLASSRLVLLALADNAGDDGDAWPSQANIAEKAGIAVRTCKDCLQWLEARGYITRHTKAMGQGRGSRTSYRLHVLTGVEPRLPMPPKPTRKKRPETSRNTETNRGADFAGANFAGANERHWKGEPPPLTNHHEPSSIKEDTRAREKPNAKGSRIPESWTPSDNDIAFALKEGMTHDDIKSTADEFRDYWLAVAGASARKTDWEATWRNRVRAKLKEPTRSAGRFRPAGGGYPSSAERREETNRRNSAEAKRLLGLKPDLAGGADNRAGYADGNVIDITPLRGAAGRDIFD
jgi:hypothetical protein